jgi:hypothetical protein
MEGYIGLYRQMIKWEWYQDVTTKAVFIHLLLLASHEGGNWQGQVIKRGQLITGRKRLAKDLGLTERQIRTSLSRLKSTKEVSIVSTNLNSVITITNYETYNPRDEKRTSKPTKDCANERPASDQQTTTLKNVKKVENEKKEKDLCDSSGKDAGKTKRQKKQEGWQKLYDDLWEMYPKRDGKKIGKTKAFDRLLDIHDKHYEDIFNAVKNFAKAKEINNYGIKDFERFLKDDHYREWLESPTTASNNGDAPTYEEKLEYHSLSHVQARFKILNREGYIARTNSDDEHWYIPDDTANVHELTDHRREVDKFRRARDLRHELTAEEKARWYKANPGQ